MLRMNKININHTYQAVTYYWAPLEDNNKEKQEEEIKIILKVNLKQKPKSNKWTQRMDRRQAIRGQQNQQNIITDSRATSRFIAEDLNLPKTGPSQIEVYLPDDSKLQSSRKTQLPFEQLDPKPREADILPGLKKSLLSVKKMSENRYTTIFLPDNKGVTIHKKGTLTITTSKPPVLQGCKTNGAKLWTASAQNTNQASKQALNAYSLPSIGQTIKYLHAAAGYPPEETWTKAIRAGNYNTFPSLTTANVYRRYPESNKSQKGHMKHQCQGVRSKKQLKTIIEEEGRGTHTRTKNPHRDPRNHDQPHQSNHFNKTKGQQDERGRHKNSQCK
jgi:hypothetical protein